MEIHLNKKLNPIYKEVHDSPNNYFLTKKNHKTSEWMQRYISVYHQLFKEFDSKKINYKKNEKKQNTTSNSELLQKLFTELHENYPDNKKILEALWASGVELRGCPKTQALYPHVISASEKDRLRWLDDH
jgi:hypothetical protein